MPLTREDDAFWLARAALADYGPRPPPGLMSGLLALAGSHTAGARTLPRRGASCARARPARTKPQVGPGGSLRRARAAAHRHSSWLYGLPRGQQRGSLRVVRESGRAMRTTEGLGVLRASASEPRCACGRGTGLHRCTPGLRDVLRVLPPNLDRQLTADIWGNQGTVQVAAPTLPAGRATRTASPSACMPKSATAPAPASVFRASARCSCRWAVSRMASAR